MKVTVELPESILDQPEHPELEVFREMVLSAYARGRISGGRVAELLNIDRWSGDQLLATRGLTRPYTLQDAREDLEAVQRLLGCT
jgi:predicted HTH domain antitoxin